MASRGEIQTVVCGNHVAAYKTDEQASYLNKLGVLAPTLERIGPNARILSIGPGTGGVESLLAQQHQVFAIDVNRQALQSAREENPLIKTALASALQLPFTQESFDVLWAGTLGHEIYSIFGPEGMQTWYKEMARVLKPKGEIVFRDWNGPDQGDKKVTIKLKNRLARNFAPIFFKNFPETGSHPYNKKRKDLITTDMQLASDFAFHLSWVPFVLKYYNGDLTEFIREEIPQTYCYSSLEGHLQMAKEAGLELTDVKYEDNTIGREVINRSVRIFSVADKKNVSIPPSKISFILRKK